MPKRPLISCILLAKGNRQPAAYAAELFLKQTYQPLELIVVADGGNWTQNPIPVDPSIRFFQMPEKSAAGIKRNFACDQARGDVILHWEEGAWYARDRVSRMVSPILEHRADFCWLEEILSYDYLEEKGSLWKTTGAVSHIGSYCYRKTLWAKNRFPETGEGAEEVAFVKNAPGRLAISEKTCQVLLVGKNAKPTGLPTDSTRHDYDAGKIQKLMGDDLAAYIDGIQTKSWQPGFSSRTQTPAENNRARKTLLSPDRPLVSCIMPTADRRHFIPNAITCFLRQDYPSCELIILDDGQDCISDLIPYDPRIRYFRISGKHTIGAKRNYACGKARGEIIAHWDDDDWSAPWRLSYQVELLLAQEADICGIDRVIFWQPDSKSSWEYIYPQDEQPWVYGGALCYTKAFWLKKPFPDINVGEDNEFVWKGPARKMLQLEQNNFYVGVIHGSNSSPKATDDPRWRPIAEARVRDLMGADWRDWQNLAAPRSRAIEKEGPQIGENPLGAREDGRLRWEVNVRLAPRHAIVEQPEPFDRPFHNAFAKNNDRQLAAPVADGPRMDIDTGMISPARHKIIQIELTNACPHGCSNCTRFCSHVRKPFFMDYTTFRKAVFSLRDFPGMVGIMGGEPTLHPDFEGFVEFYADHIGPGEKSVNGRAPIHDFSAYRERRLSGLNVKRGLWTSLGDRYYQHYELIQEVFDYQCINDHVNQGFHQALLISRKSLGLEDEEWIKLRNNCWVQRLWSSSITPKGAFFCEVAAAMDMLFNGPGGWPIQPGWWRRTPEEFGDQLKWCELCSAPLQVPRRLANEKIDDVCPRAYKRLQSINAPSIGKDRVQILDVENYRPEDHKCNPNSNWYMPEDARRIASTNKSLHMRKLEAVTVCVDYGDFLAQTLPGNMEHFDRYVIVTSSDDKETQDVARKYGAVLVIYEDFQKREVFNKGKMINRGLKELELSDWLLFTDADIFLPLRLRKNLEKLVLNPGCLYYTSRYNLPDNTLSEITSFRRNRDRLWDFSMDDPSTNCWPWGYFQLFNINARALQFRRQKLVSESFPGAGGVDSHFCDLWPLDKRILLPQDQRKFDVVHIPHGPLGINWNGRRNMDKDTWIAAAQINSSGIYVHHYWPDECYLKLIRCDTGQAVITKYRTGAFCQFFNGGFQFCANHIGFWSRRHTIAVDRANKGKIIVYANNGCEYSGWGLGHVMWEDDRQGYVWNGEPIEPTTFELCFRLTLDDGDKPCLNS